MSSSEHSMFRHSNFWEERYLDGDTPWDKGEAAPPLNAYLENHKIAGKVCVPGCGAGYDVRALAQQGALVTGLDIAPSALRKAASFPAAGGEQYLRADWFQLPRELSGCFDYVFEHTCFCAIEPEKRSDYVKSCAQALKPEGQLLGIFFMTPDAEVGPPFGTSLDELDQLFAAEFELIHDEVPVAAYPGREGRERLRLLKKI
ncbi:MAG: methyltransferase domain-containing protein [Verrucomicrobiota bacterium]